MKKTLGDCPQSSSPLANFWFKMHILLHFLTFMNAASFSRFPCLSTSPAHFRSPSCYFLSILVVWQRQRIVRQAVDPCWPITDDGFCSWALAWQCRPRSPERPHTHTHRHTQTIHTPHTLQASPFEGTYNLQHTHMEGHNLALSPPSKRKECWWDRTSATCLSASAVMSGTYQVYK